MQIASNKLSDLYAYYNSKLASLYDDEELYAIFELVCEKYLKYSKQETKEKFNSNINQSDVLKIYDTAKALKTGIPIQYVLQEAFFYDSLFYVTPDVLIPRPETEELVDIIIKGCKTTNLQNLKILDIGTGSGCIPIILKKHIPEADVFGIDISEGALEVAIKNASQNQTPVTFKKINILDQEMSYQWFESDPLFSIIVSNPPYIAIKEAQKMDARVLNHEPHLALFVEGNDPIRFYKEIINFCQHHLAAKGLLYFELNPLFALDVKNYADTVNLFNFTELINDMSGKTRFLKAQMK